MKKFFLFKAVQKHLKFKGVELGCSLTEFTDKLVNLGDQLMETSINGVWIKGEFAGEPDCDFLVKATPKSKIVSEVCVIYDKSLYVDWHSIKSHYFKLKEILTKKYGYPKSVEEFTSPYQEGDGLEMVALVREKCNYMSFFKTPVGRIVLSIGFEKNILVLYEDKSSRAIKEMEEV